MSLLLDKKELKKAAKEITTIKLHEVIGTLNEVMAERQKETEVLSQIKELAKSQGFTLEQLGYKLDPEAVVTSPAEEEKKPGRPIKPKFKTTNPDSQFFYVEDGKLHHLKTHTMKQGLVDRGIKVVPFHKVEAKYKKDVEALLAEAVAFSTANFNQKVAVWNEWAAQNNEEQLQPRT